MTDELALAAARVEITDKQRTKFLAALRKQPTTGTAKALRAAGVKGTRGQLKRLLHEDDDLAADAREARGYGDHTIRDEIRRRAIEGVDEPVFHQGEVAGYVTKYSDRLLGMMAKAYLPEYRERVEVSGAGGAPIPVEVNGARITGISDVFQLARAVGAGLRDGLSPGPARDALPAAPPALPDPPDG